MAKQVTYQEIKKKNKDLKKCQRGISQAPSPIPRPSICHEYAIFLSLSWPHLPPHIHFSNFNCHLLLHVTLSVTPFFFSQRQTHKSGIIKPSNSFKLVRYYKFKITPREKMPFWIWVCGRHRRRRRRRRQWGDGRAVRKLAWKKGGGRRRKMTGWKSTFLLMVKALGDPSPKMQVTSHLHFPDKTNYSTRPLPFSSFFTNLFLPAIKQTLHPYIQ